MTKTPRLVMPFNPQATLTPPGPEALATCMRDLWEAKSLADDGKITEIEGAAAQLLAFVNLLKSTPAALPFRLYTPIEKLLLDVVDISGGAAPSRILKNAEEPKRGRPINATLTMAHASLGAVLHLLVEHGRGTAADTWAELIAKDANRAEVCGPTRNGNRVPIQAQHVKQWCSDVTGGRANPLHVSMSIRLRLLLADRFCAADGDHDRLSAVAKSVIGQIAAGFV